MPLRTTVLREQSIHNRTPQMHAVKEVLLSKSDLRRVIRTSDRNLSLDREALET